VALRIQHSAAGSGYSTFENEVAGNVFYNCRNGIYIASGGAAYQNFRQNVHDNTFVKGPDISLVYGIRELGAGSDNDYHVYHGNNMVGPFTTAAFGFVGTHSAARDNRNFNPQGVAAITPGASPWTYTNNDNVPEVVHLDGARGAAGTLTVVKNSITLYSIGNDEKFHLAIPLEPGEAITVTYTSGAGDTLTANKDRK